MFGLFGTLISVVQIYFSGEFDFITRRENYTRFLNVHIITNGSTSEEVIDETATNRTVQLSFVVYQV